MPHLLNRSHLSPYHRLFILFLFVLILPACKISGTVALDGAGVEGAVVLLSGSIEAKAVTDKKGAYSFSKVPKGLYTVTLQPTKGFTGKPVKRVTKSNNSVSVTHVDFSMDTHTLRMISTGPVIGTREDNGVASWWGIPFARPPVGDLRWKAPVSPEDWGETPYLAIEPCLPCTQYSDVINDGPVEYYGTVMGSEDCLYLNVFASDTPSEGKKPVMFWIHGGGNSVGEAAIYNGKKLAETYNVVVVSINYRLGPFGWFSHPALNSEDSSAEDRSGNYGTLDMIRALHWVQENIESFGGDKNNVMVFGESAGGQATLAMMASPLASGLFHKAAVESGVLYWVAEHTAWEPKVRAENYTDDPQPGLARSSREVVNDLLIYSGVALNRVTAKFIQDSMPDADLSEYLRNLSANDIMSVYTTSKGGIITMPTVIQDGTVIPEEDPMDLFESGNYNKVPVILGTNRDEMKLFMMFDPNYVNNIMNTIPVVLNHKNYELSGYYYSRAWKATMADRLADALSVNQPDSVYVYRFDWDEEPNIVGFDIAFIIGAAHGIEIPFVFASPDFSVLASKKQFIYTAKNKPGRYALADTMSSYWAALAFSGSPGNGMPGHPQTALWQPWSTESSEHNLMIFDTPETSGTRMTIQYLTLDDVRTELQAETGYSSPDVKCRVYHDIFGDDAYYAETCAGE